MKRILLVCYLVLFYATGSVFAQCETRDLIGLGVHDRHAEALGCDNLTGDVDITGTLTASGATTLSSTLGVTGATTLSSTLGVTGATTLTGALDANSTVTAAGVTLDDATTLKLDVGTIAAAGSDDTDGTAIVDQITYVTGADGTKGVELPTGSLGAIYIVHNADATNALKVYPPASGTINGGTATTGDVAVAAEETAFFILMAANTWYGGVAVDF